MVVYQFKRNRTRYRPLAHPLRISRTSPIVAILHVRNGILFLFRNPILLLTTAIVVVLIIATIGESITVGHIESQIVTAQQQNEHVRTEIKSIQSRIALLSTDDTVIREAENMGYQHS
jgi:hypothetical protein